MKIVPATSIFILMCLIDNLVDSADCGGLIVTSSEISSHTSLFNPSKLLIPSVPILSLYIKVKGVA